MTEILQHANQAAELAGIPAETFLQARIHYHTLEVANPTHPDRLAHLSMLLDSASTLSDVIGYANLGPDSDSGPADEPEDPDEPEDDGVLVGAPDEAVNAVASENRSFLMQMLDRAKGR
jgi:hypothetical protein